MIVWTRLFRNRIKTFAFSNISVYGWMVMYQKSIVIGYVAKIDCASVPHHFKLINPDKNYYSIRKNSVNS